MRQQLIRLMAWIKMDLLICNDFIACSPLCSSVVKIGTAFPYTRVRKFETTRVWTPLGVWSTTKVMYPEYFKTQLNVVQKSENLTTIAGPWYFGRVLVPQRLINLSLYQEILRLQKFNNILGKVLKQSIFSLY